MKDQILLIVEELEERIAPSVNGTGGYEGHTGNQSSSHGNPSGSANPEGSATPENKAGNWAVA
jgi:hypothetical protein